jgi:endonuclease G
MKANAVVNPQPSTPGRKQVFDYERFSVVMNKRRRLAYYTVVNIDGAQKQPMKRQQDSWSFDPRLDKDLQVGGEMYAGNALDQGHLVRRLDAAWGASVAAAKKGNDDTFHYTNCAPQHLTFNRGGELWQGIENYLLDKAQRISKRLTVFTGPVFRANDPPFKNDAMAKPVRIPLDYWKVAAMVKEGGKKVAAGFVVTQADLIGDATDLEERFQPAVFQVPLREIEKLTGLKFNSLREHDTIEDEGALERSEALDAGVRPLGALADIEV